MKISVLFKICLFVFLCVNCLNIGRFDIFFNIVQAQTLVPGLNLNSINNNTANKKAVSGAVTGKYYEYQSICRGPKTEDPLELETEDKKVSEALDLIKKTRYREAISQLEKILETKSENIDALYAISYAYKKYNNLYEAKNALQDIIKLERLKNKKLNLIPKKYLIDLCALEVQDSNHNDAEDTCKVVIKTLPEESLPLIYLSVSFREQEKYKEALELLEKSLKIKKSEFAMTCRAEIYHLQKKSLEAIKAYDESVAVDAKSARAYLGKAMIQYELEKYDEALTSYVSACKLDKTYAFQFRKAQVELEKNKNLISEKYYASIKQCLQ